ncbi:MAG: MFS transporter [Clostridia bacterium]
MNLAHVFFPTEPPSESELAQSRKRIIAESAVGAVLYAVATGNFYAGYLSRLGASMSLCALVASIPQLGCVLQFFSPFVFEKLKQRKLAITLCLMTYRLLLSLSMILPLLLGSVMGSDGLISLAVTLYFIAFMAAGLVTPALSHMIMAIAPASRRGSFFARKDIIATCVNSIAMFGMGKQLDYFGSIGQQETGYAVIGCISLLLACLDAALLLSLREEPAPYVSSVRLQNLLAPIRDANYRPMLRYNVIGGFAGGLSASFLMVYMLRVLHLSHTFITSATIAASCVGIMGSFFWGRYADKTTWNVIIKRAATLSMFCTLGWELVTPALAHVVAPVLLVITSACAGGLSIAGMNLQYALSPPEAKTTYIAITSAIASICAVAAVSLSTALQPLLGQLLGEKSISVLFLVSAVGGFANLIVNARRLPAVK